MKIYRDPYTKLNIPTVVALGCFDGVHAAHAAVIREAVRIARERGITPALWCFSEPPKNAYLASPVPLICNERDKAGYIESLGIEIMVTPDFTPSISSVTARDFIRVLLCEYAGAVCLVCGRNYTFGSGGKGDTRMLESLCDEMGISLCVLDDVLSDGEKVSSTLIREAIGEGKCTLAARLLGRTFSVSAKRTDNGVYTVPKKYLAPTDGRYAVRIDEEDTTSDAVVTLTHTPEGCVIYTGAHSQASEIKIRFTSDREDGI